MKKKILFVIPTLTMAGAERVLITLDKKLKKKYDVKTLVFNRVKNEYKYDKDRLFCLNESKNKLIRTIQRPKKIAEFCEENDIDIIISFMDRTNIYCLLAKKATKRNINIYCTIHNIYFKRPIYKIPGKILYTYAKKVICVSKEMEKELKKVYKINNTTTIHNPINIKQNLERAKENILSKDKKYFDGNFVFINIGRLIEQKNHKALIISFKKVIGVNSKAKLLIIGEGHKRDELEKLILYLGLSENVFLLGTRKNVHPYLKKSNCFVFSSLWEGFGLVIIEAMAMGLPIISTDYKYGAREILDKENLICINENLETQLTSKMCLAMDKTNINRYNIERANAFDINKIIKQWESLLNEES